MPLKNLLSKLNPASKKSTDPIYSLVCSGGGALGAYQVGAIRYIHEHFCVGEQSPFQVFTGASCGSLNTTFLACESFQAKSSSLRLEQLWTKFHVPAYHQNIFKSVRTSLIQYFRKRDRGWSLFNPQPMIDIIREGLIRTNLEKSFEMHSTLGVAIAATEIVSCHPVWFVEGPNAVEWRRFHSLAFKHKIGLQQVAASCSFPIFMPPVKVGDHYYIDGAMKLERPFSAAISMGSTKILCISTKVDENPELPKYHKNFKPGYAALFRLLMKSLNQELIVSEAEQLKILNRLMLHVDQEKKQGQLSETMHNALFDEKFSMSSYKPIEVMLLQPSESPDKLFREFKKEHKSRTHSPDPFLFHKDFIKKLIEMGYAETREKHKELEKFFSEVRSKT